MANIQNSVVLKDGELTQPDVDYLARWWRSYGDEVVGARDLIKTVGMPPGMEGRPDQTSHLHVGKWLRSVDGTSVCVDGRPVTVKRVKMGMGTPKWVILPIYISD